MQISKVIILLVSVAVLPSCFVQQDQYDETVAELERVSAELAELKASLVKARYIGVDPQLEIYIPDVEFVPGAGIPSAK